MFYRVLLFALLLTSSQPLITESFARGSDLNIELPRERAQESLKNLKRDSIVYFLRSYYKQSDEAENLTETQISIRSGLIPEEIVRRLRFTEQNEQNLDPLVVLKKLAQEGYYNQYRNLRHSPFEIPDNWETLRNKLRLDDFEIWQRETIEKSAVKGEKRLIYRTQRSAKEKRGTFSIPPLSLAFTLKENGEVREIEVIVKREGSLGDWDFYVYGNDGKLTTQSEFISNSGGPVKGGFAPFTCMTCHYNENSRRFQNFPLRPREYSY